MNDYITTTEQSTTKPCAYLLGYTVVTTSQLLTVTLVRQCDLSYWWNWEKAGSADTDGLTGSCRGYSKSGPYRKFISQKPALEVYYVIFVIPFPCYIIVKFTSIYGDANLTIDDFPLPQLCPLLFRCGWCEFKCGWSCEVICCADLFYIYNRVPDQNILYNAFKNIQWKPAVFVKCRYVWYYLYGIEKKNLNPQRPKNSVMYGLIFRYWLIFTIAFIADICIYIQDNICTMMP